jgi:hypothetical protein
VSEIFARSPKKDKAAGMSHVQPHLICNLHLLANETATAVAATSTDTGKKGKAGKASNASSSNSTVAAVSNSTSTDTGKKAKVRKHRQKEIGVLC